MTQPNKTPVAALVSALVCVAVLSGAPPAQAGPIRAGLKVTLGFAGQGQVTARSLFGTSTSRDDLLPTGGLSLFGEYQLFQFLSVGGTFGLSWWKTDEMAADNIAPNLVVDLAAVVRGHYRLLDDALMVYLAFPLGLSISELSADYTGDLFGNDLDTGVGANIALLAGAAFQIWSGLHVFAEIGWQYHLLDHATSVLGYDLDLEFEGSQLALNVGAWWEF